MIDPTPIKQRHCSFRMTSSASNYASAPRTTTTTTTTNTGTIDNLTTNTNGNQCIEESVNCYTFRRPQVSILSEYKMNKKAGRNHFNRYSDVIVNDKRKTSKICDKLLSQKSSLESSSGWRLYYLSSQFDDLAQLEHDLRESLVLCKNEIPSPNSEGECMDTGLFGNSDDSNHRLDSEDSQLRMLHELLQGNLQRCQHSIEQLQEAKQSMFNLLEHRQVYTEIRNQKLTKFKEKGVS